MTHILILQGHPDPQPSRLCVALAEAYAAGALAAGHQVTQLSLAEMDLPLLRRPEDFRDGSPPEAVREAQAALHAAQHWVLIYPLWLGGMPALVKGFLEQTLRPGFAFREGAGLKGGLLHGRSARVIITMGMPVFIYRWWFGAVSLKALRRHILQFCGIGPIRETLVGGVDSLTPARAAALFAQMRKCAAAAR